MVVAATSLFGTTVITSLLGFAFWAVAARLYSPAAVGTSSAAVSAMQFLATVGILGLGTLIIGEVRHQPDGAGLIAAASIVATALSVVAGVIFVLLAPLIHAHLGPLGRGSAGPALFVAGVGLTGFTIVIDQACIGLLRGGLQFWRNAVFAAVKLALLPVGLLWPSLDGAIVVYGTWVVGIAVSMVTQYIHARREGLRPRAIPHWASLRALRGAALSHHWLNLSSYGPRLILPVIVTSILGPEQSAAFYAALLVITFANIIPVHLSTALFSLGRGDTAGLTREIRHTLSLSAVVSVASAAAFAALSYPILRLIGRDYVIATWAMILLGLTTLPLTVKAHYMAICRVQDRLNVCAAVVTAGGLLELVLAGLGATTWGLAGVAGAYLIAQLIEAVVLWPTVARAAEWPLLPFLRRKVES